MMSPLVPLIAITLHNPQANLQKLRPGLEWAGRADLSLRPDRMERWSARHLGIERPFDPESMRTIGIDPEAPIKIMLPTENGPLIIELAVKEASKVDRLIERSKAKKLDVLLTRIEQRLVVQQIRDRSRAEKEFEEAESVVRPKKGRGPLTIEVSDYQPIDHALIEIDLSKGQIEALASASLSLPARLLFDEFLGDRPSQRYLAPIGGIAELCGTFGAGAIREGLVEAGMTTAEADQARKIFAGEHSVALTKEGVLALVARLNGSASKKEIAAFVERLRAVQPQIQVRELDGFLLAWFPGVDPKATVDLSVDRMSGSASGEAPIDLRLDPPSLVSALRKRSRTKLGPHVGSAHLTIFEALFENLLRRTTSSRLLVSKERGEIQVRAIVGYR